MNTLTSTKEETKTYAIDPVHSRVEFEVKHLGISTFRGDFSVYEGEIETSPEGLESVRGTVDINSIRVPEDALTQHLLSADFFDADNHPTGSFEAKEIISADAALVVKGDLTLRGTTKEVELVGILQEGIGMDGSSTLAIEASGEIDRRDYGISWESSLDNGAAVVAEKVTIKLHIEAREA